MPISAYVIRCAIAEQSVVQAQLRALPGVEPAEPTDTGIPFAADTLTTRAAEEPGERLQRLPGVKAAVLVYHNFVDVAEAL